MNISIIVNSLKYINDFKLINKLSIWIYEELKLINYSDTKLVISFERRDYEVTKDIILLINDKELLSKFIDEEYIKGYELIITKLFLSIDYCKEELLTSASYYDQIEIVKMLLENGADVHAYYDYALKYASEKGHTKIVKLLLENGADIHAHNDYALRWSCYYGHIKTVKLLLENGADVHAYYDYALKYASDNAHTEIVKLLLENGADYDSQLATNDGYDEINDFI